MAKVLVLGASGFLGSHVTKALVNDGRDVRILVRDSSDTSVTDDLEIERMRGNVFDPDVLVEAMDGCDTIYYCIVDTRAWLRDPAPLYEVNVEGLRTVMDVAMEKAIGKFLYTSTFGTLGRREDGPSTEADAFNWWDEAPDYIRCRVDAENLLMEYCEQKGFSGVACCIGNTYGPEDVAPTPHGELVMNVAKGRLPVYWRGGGPSLGIVDAAMGMLLAEKHGKTGERYAFAERWVEFRELFEMAARAAGTKPPGIEVPMPVLYSVAFVTELFCRLINRENKVSVSSIKCASMLPDIDCSKAKQELAWVPQPIEQSVEKAVAYYLANS